MSLQTLVSYVRDYTQLHLSAYVEELRVLCAIDSQSYYKPGLDQMVEVLSTRMRGLGMNITVFEQEQWGNDLLATIEGEGSENIVVVGHMDTVYPVGTAAARPLKMEDNKVYGPGTSDMKGCILAAIYAIEALLSQGYRPFRELRFLCLSDEEISNRHSEAIICNVVRDCQAALVLESAYTNGDIVSARKGTVHYKLIARGRSAHAGVEPEKGRNAVVELAHQILQIQTLNGWCEGLTVTPSLTTGGVAENSVPDYAETIFDVRFLDQQQRSATEDRMRNIIQKHLILEVELTLEALPGHYQPMVRTPETMRLVHLAQELAHIVGFPLNHMLRGGGSDACYTSQYGIPTLDGLGPIGGLDHSPHEFLLLDSVPARTALLAGLIACEGNPLIQRELTSSHLIIH